MKTKYIKHSANDNVTWYYKIRKRKKGEKSLFGSSTDPLIEEIIIRYNKMFYGEACIANTTNGKSTTKAEWDIALNKLKLYINKLK